MQSLVTQHNVFTNQIDILQAFIQKETTTWRWQQWQGVYFSSPPGYDKDPLYVYRPLKHFYAMPSAARLGAWRTKICAFLAKERCVTVGFEKITWTITIHGICILLGTYIDDFVITCTN